RVFCKSTRRVEGFSGNPLSVVSGVLMSGFRASLIGVPGRFRFGASWRHGQRVRRRSDPLVRTRSVACRTGPARCTVPLERLGHMTEYTTVAWGILGPGRIAGAFARDLPESKTGRLVAVAGRSRDKADEFAR